MPKKGQRQKECLRGHPFDAENTYVSPRGTRQCRTCQKLRDRIASHSLLQKPCRQCGAIDRTKRGDCRSCNRSRCRAYQKNHLVEGRERVKAWIKKNMVRYKSMRKKIAAIYHQRHKEKIRARLRRWAKANPEKFKALRSRASLAYLARRRGAPISDLTEGQWSAIKMAFSHRCAYCRKKPKTLTQDHITAVSAGGSHTISNVVPACASCNARKGNRQPLRPVQPLLVAPMRSA